MHRFTFGWLATLLLAAPAFAHTEPAHFKGMLTNDAPRVHHASVYFDADGPSDTPVEQMTREQLQAEYRRLDADRPGLGMGLGLTIGGGAGLLVGVYFLYLGLIDVFFLTGVDSTLTAAGYVFIGIGVVVGIVGAVLLTVGLIKLFGTLAKRRAYGARMDDINARLEQLDRSGAPGYPPGYPPPPAPGYDSPPPPPPPPPPPGALFNTPQPSLVLASF